MKRKNESGVVMVEALIVVTIVTMFITVMLYLGMILYQQSVVNIMANQTASNIAQIYGNTLRDPFTGYVDADGVHETVTYANIRNQAYYDVLSQKTDALAMYRLKSSRILNTGTTEVDVEIVPKKNELLKEQIVVTVKEDYALSLISFFGVNDSKVTFVGTGRADCVDLLDYFSGIPALGDPDGNAVVFTDECTVNFYKHYGDTRPLKTVTVLRDHSVNSSTERTHSLMPQKPIQDRMRFVKWITRDGQNFDGSTIVARNMNVYGVWEGTITFDPDGGTVTPTTMDATIGSNVRLPKAVRENCTFAGWYTEKNGQGEEFTGVDFQGDITVYAKWVCSVVFNPDGGEVSPDSVEVICGSSLQGAGYALPTPTREGCTFAGWYTGHYGEGNSFAVNQPIHGHTTVVAKWTCQVKYLDTDGRELFPAQTVVAGKSASLQTPSRPHDGDKGWQFLGWKTADGRDFNGSAVFTKHEELHAQWECKHVYEFVKTIKEATCEADGKNLEECKYCHAQREVGLKSFGGHKEGSPKITNAGCVTEGSKKWYCENCYQCLREEKIDKSGHTLGNCGRKHKDVAFLGITNDHKVPEGHQQNWSSCIACPKCKTILTKEVLCGTCYSKWGADGGWGKYKTVVNVPGHTSGKKLDREESY